MHGVLESKDRRVVLIRVTTTAATTMVLAALLLGLVINGCLLTPGDVQWYDG